VHKYAFGFVVVALSLVALPWANAGVTTRASVGSDGTQGNGLSLWPSISADGRCVAFTSGATNLVARDTDGCYDVFVHDRDTEQTARVSVASDGTQGNGPSSWPSISADGRYVAFVSGADNLVSGDTNGRDDIFVYDRQTGQTTRVSVASDGTQGNGFSWQPSISSDGRYVAFLSGANNLVPGDTNWYEDVFVHDRQTGQTTRVSVASNGSQGDEESGAPSISADGRFVAFASAADNLAPGGRSGMDVFVRDRQTGRTSRVSVRTDGRGGNHLSYFPSISGDGRCVAFNSLATNLVPNDTNGCDDIFVHDRATGQTTRVSVASDGTQGDAWSYGASVSADGRYVGFRSLASNLVAGDTNACEDTFVHDRQTGHTTRVSVASDGTQGNGWSEFPSLSAEGRYVAFRSGASNLVVGDTNRADDVFVRDRGGGQPTLSWLGTPGYERDAVDPGNGTARQTRFLFKVRYEDFEGNAPRYVSLHLRRNGKYSGEFAMVRGVGDYTEGRVYRRRPKLPAGEYEYRFQARDRDGLAVGEPTEWHAGPTVTAAPSVALTSLSAAPTGAGTQITFSLSSAAQVEARILNIAGRPVKTLCQAKECEAGTNTLLWNAQSENGLSVPNGTYLVEVLAKAADGAQARGLARVSVGR
jgi:Tol biopolymer transport system component